MPLTVFFSWQLDRPSTTGRNLIESALQKAVGRIGADLEEAIREELVVDKDTKGVPGQPPIVDTIFWKIDGAAVFVPDLTFAGIRADGERPTPNPNVLIEYGWALKALGWHRIVPVMNTWHGEPTAQSMPFDMGHLRRPLTYSCPDDAGDDTRKAVREQLAKDLETALRTVFDSDEFRDSRPKPPQPLPFPAAESKDGPGRFRAKGKAIGIVHNLPFFTTASGQDVHLADGAAMWLRVMPTADIGRTWPVTELERLAGTNPLFLALCRTYQSFHHVRGEDGFGLFATINDTPGTANCLAYAFRTGEVWSIDSRLLDAIPERGIPSVDIQRIFADALENAIAFMSRLGIDPPYRWIAGMTEMRGRKLFVPAPPGQMSAFPGPQGTCLKDDVVVDGTYRPDQTARQALQPFFTEVFDACGVPWPQWMDQ